MSRSTTSGVALSMMGCLTTNALVAAGKVTKGKRFT